MGLSCIKLCLEYFFILIILNLPVQKLAHMLDLLNLLIFLIEIFFFNFLLIKMGYHFLNQLILDLEFFFLIHEFALCEDGTRLFVDEKLSLLLPAVEFPSPLEILLIHEKAIRFLHFPVLLLFLALLNFPLLFKKI